MQSIIVSLQAPDDESVLKRARALVDKVAAAEIRLDLMQQFDLQRIFVGTPLPLVATYRPAREGGHHTGSEAERLHTLRRAAALGAYAVDVEWDAARALADLTAPRIVSRHFFAQTPLALPDVYDELAETAPDVVKIAAQANTLTDALRLAQLWLSADRPLVAIAMGELGVFTRLMAPFFRQSWLSYAAFAPDATVAPGQLAWQVMLRDYYFDRLAPGTNVLGVLLPSGTDFKPLSLALNCRWRKRNHNYWAVPLYWRESEALDEVKERWFALGTRALWWPDRSRLWIHDDDGTERNLASALPSDLPVLP